MALNSAYFSWASQHGTSYLTGLLSPQKAGFMWIVKLALNRPYTFVVAAILILFLGTAAIVNTPTDIFPDIDIP